MPHRQSVLPGEYRWGPFSGLLPPIALSIGHIPADAKPARGTGLQPFWFYEDGFATVSSTACRGNAAQDFWMGWAVRNTADVEPELECATGASVADITSCDRNYQKNARIFEPAKVDRMPSFEQQQPQGGHGFCRYSEKCTRAVFQEAEGLR
ncbi:hypothetical protein [uncultured Roseobacter sp.]|uniref:hypothetical protein n=1 Tax=uncultured Roseobacter sp. TaxID=114847 RepID=UPI00262EE3F1|nr:hypothetical protein [uncultured Roseobacter sp.]